MSARIDSDMGIEDMRDRPPGSQDTFVNLWFPLEECNDDILAVCDLSNLTKSELKKIETTKSKTLQITPSETEKSYIKNLKFHPSLQWFSQLPMQQGQFVLFKSDDTFHASAAAIKSSSTESRECAPRKSVDMRLGIRTSPGYGV